MNMKNNCWKIASDIVTTISRLILLTCVVYGFYITCTPGYYVLLITYVFIILFSSFAWYKFKKLLNKEHSKFSSEGFTERKYGSTYRKRYYSNIYIISLFIVCVILVTNACMIFIKQCDEELTNQYLESVEQIMGEDSNTVDILRRTSFLIPNASKRALVYNVDFIKMTEDLTELLNNAKAEGSIDNEKIEAFKERALFLSNKIDIELTLSKYVIAYILTSLFLLKISVKELKNLLNHRSIELK